MHASTVTCLLFLLKKLNVIIAFMQESGSWRKLHTLEIERVITLSSH